MIGVASAWTWDVLLSFASEIRMFWKHEFPTLPDVVCLLACITTAGYLIAMPLLAVAPFSCYTLTKTADWFGALALPCNSLLFLLRVKAAFHESRWISGAFCVLWLSTLGSFTGPFTIDAVNIDGLHCVLDVQRLSAFGFLAVAVFDIIVFLAISIQVVTYAEWDEN
ncbi:unnamed protein product [Somion occarium]|uniref:Uncharacterized protein n=1 Tax=Somion occarium TaxID=3059160 RepID=A0ABP1EB30_9APHY